MTCRVIRIKGYRFLALFEGALTLARVIVNVDGGLVMWQGKRVQGQRFLDFRNRFVVPALSPQPNQRIHVVGFRGVRVECNGALEV